MCRGNSGTLRLTINPLSDRPVLTITNVNPRVNEDVDDVWSFYGADAFDDGVWDCSLYGSRYFDCASGSASSTFGVI